MEKKKRRVIRDDLDEDEDVHLDYVHSAKERIPLMGGKEMREGLAEEFAKQVETGFIISGTETKQVDIMRECSEAGEAADAAKMKFAAGEVAQNWADFPRSLLTLAAELAKSTHAPVRRVANGLEWTLRDKVIIGIYYTDKGVELVQPGRPITLDACTSGTKSKVKNGKGIGGYGDGMKTAFQTLCAAGYDATFTFRGFDDEDATRVMTWEWKSAVPQDYTESHLVVDISASHEEEPVDCDMPTMVTAINATRGASVEALHRAFTDALCRFQWLLFEVKDDPEGRTISTPEHGSWRHASTFHPVVDCIVPGHSVTMPHSRMKCCVQGVFYECQAIADCMPADLVVTFPGRGMLHNPPEEIKLFNNMLREPNCNNVGWAFGWQFDAFMKIATEEGDEKKREEMKKLLVKAFWPLLHGGTSLLMRHGRVGQLMQHIIQYFAAPTGSATCSSTRSSCPSVPPHGRRRRRGRWSRPR